MLFDVHEDNIVELVLSSRLYMASGIAGLVWLLHNASSPQLWIAHC